MPVIRLKGQKREYMFSVVEANYDNMPEWGGIYIIVRANRNGLEIENCLAMGSCASFHEYAHKIRELTYGKPATHIYLLPEFQKQHRQFAIEDLMSTEAFRDIYLQMLDEQAPELESSEPLHADV
ncbi:MAG: hypothetical protein VX154_05495 [Pseudomonadota bacterium]|nr:hypothetical protein [Pseudomonadota bacterium]